MPNYSKTSVKRKVRQMKEIEKRGKKKVNLLCVLFRKTLTALSVLIIIFGGIFIGLYLILYPKYQEYRELAITAVEESSRDTFADNTNSYIYDKNGDLISKLVDEDFADYISYDDIPENVINAFVAVEDRNFWEHNGFDLNGILRVGYRFIITGGEEVHGASTITQQLARNTFLTNEVTLERKAKEILIAVELEKKYSKEDIMEFYVNNAYFANRCYGIEAAAKKYFSKTASELTLSETAYLCAIPNAPSYYDPLTNPDNAISRRNKILGDMYECGYITNSEYEEALSEEINLNVYEEEPIQNYETTYAIDCATRYLMSLNGFEFRYEYTDMDDYNSYLESYNVAYAEMREELYRGGYRIYTSLDPDAQSILQTSIDENMSFNDETNEDGTYALQSAATVIDNNTHKVIAIVGGRTQDSGTYTLNRAYQSYRQPGSAFKPLAVYAPALDNGYTPDSMLTEISVTKAKEKDADPTTMSGSQMTLRSAVERSKNGCAWWLFCMITPQKGLSYITEMEFTKIVPDDYYPAASLGGLTYGVTTVEMANGYSTLVNGGIYNEATCITSMKDIEGNEIFEEKESKQVYSAKAATEMIDVLQGVIKRGTASSMGWRSNVEAAGKTGTTNDSKDGWFCGVTPDYSLSVWVGFDQPRELSSLYGSTYPSRIWKEVMEQLVADTENTTFPEYDGGDDSLSLNAVGPLDYYSYLPGRDDSEVLSPGYTVQNYREDHILDDTAEQIMFQIDVMAIETNEDRTEAMEVYQKAKAIVDEIYSRKLYASESEKLSALYQRTFGGD